MSPVFFGRACFFILILSALAPSLQAQSTTTPVLPRLWLEKSTTVRQTSPTASRHEGSAFVAIVSFWPMPDDIQVTVRYPGGAFEAYRASPTTYEYRRPFDDAESMDRAFPDGNYTIEWSKGPASVTVVSAPSPVAARVTNWDALQRWNGRDQLTVVLAPTPAGAILDPTGGREAYFNVLSGTDAVLYGSGNLTSPSTSITTNTHELRIPITMPGQPFDGQVVATLQRGVNSLTATSYTTTRKFTLKFDVARAHLPAQITQQPVAKTVNAGEPLTLSVTATGSGLTYLWLKNSVAVPGATSATLTIPAAQPSDAGLYTAVVINTGGSVLSDVVPVVVNASPPVIASSPAAATLTVGDTHTFTVTVTGTGPFSYQWFRDGTAISGGTEATLKLTNLRLSDSGNYTVTVRIASGSVTSAAGALTVNPVSRISNLSIRTRVGGARGPLIVGLTVGGSAGGTKPLLLRAIGPTLGAFGVEDTLADPRLALLSGENVVAQNDDWNGSSQIATAASAAGAFALVSDATKDAALLSNLDPGGYTLRIESTGANGGVALAEVYDATANDAFIAATPRLINISALTHAGTGSDTLIVGFTIAGASVRRVLVRGIGPALASFGVASALADPKLEIYGAGSVTAIAANDNWSTPATAAETAAAASQVGAFALPAASKDAALLLSLTPGSYTAQVSGVDNTTGSALVEIYELP